MPVPLAAGTLCHDRCRSRLQMLVLCNEALCEADRVEDTSVFLQLNLQVFSYFLKTISNLFNIQLLCYAIQTQALRTLHTLRSPLTRSSWVSLLLDALLVSSTSSLVFIAWPTASTRSNSFLYLGKKAMLDMT